VHGKDRIACEVLVRKPEVKRLLETPWRDGRILLKWSLGK
jgi:hypothetical protein